jgi:hypothetical protein
MRCGCLRVLLYTQCILIPFLSFFWRVNPAPHFDGLINDEKAYVPYILLESTVNEIKRLNPSA